MNDPEQVPSTKNVEQSKAELPVKYGTDSKDTAEPERKPKEPEEPPGRLVLCCRSIFATAGGLLFKLIWAVVFIAIGAKHIDECPAQDWIPIYLIVVGSAVLLTFVVTCLWNYHQRRRDAMEDRGEILDTSCFCKWLIMVRYMLMVAMFFFTKAWFIGGSVLVYSVHGKITTKDKNALNYCNGTLYWFSFITITIVWCVIGLVVIVATCGLCIGSCIGANFLEDLENSFPWEKTRKSVKKSPQV